MINEKRKIILLSNSIEPNSGFGTMTHHHALFLYKKDIDDLRKKIELLLTDKILAKRLTDTVYKDAQQYNWNNNLKSLINLFKI